MLPFHEGSFKIATRTGCPIVPMALNNTAELFEAHFPKISPCHVVIEYGKPIYPKELSKEEQKHLGVYTRDVLLEMLKKNQPAVRL
jgi:1-acyl-sn-glycerol-3-phosphate acyltransferase